MARPKGAGEKTKEQLLQTAQALFAKKGYSATGVKELLKESGAPRGSFYFHFPDGKEQLATDAIHASAQALKDALLARLQPGMGLLQKLEALFVGLEVYLQTTHLEIGCPTAAVALESPSEGLRQASQTVYLDWEALLQEHFQYDEEEASALLAALEGALLLSKVYGHPGPLRAVAKHYGVILATES